MVSRSVYGLRGSFMDTLTAPASDMTDMQVQFYTWHALGLLTLAGGAGPKGLLY